MKGRRDMTLNDLTSDVSSYIDRLKTRFPHVDEGALRQVRNPQEVITHVADQHDLTPLEAHQEIDDWLFVEHLARQARRAGDLRAG